MGVAVKVTEVPAQIVMADAVIATEGITVVVTFIVMVLDDAVVEAMQLPPVMLISHVMVFPFASVELVNVFDAPFCTLVPFTLKL